MQRTVFICLFGVFVEIIYFLWCFAITVTVDGIHLKSLRLPVGSASLTHSGQPQFIEILLAHRIQKLGEVPGFETLY